MLPLSCHLGRRVSKSSSSSSNCRFDPRTTRVSSGWVAVRRSIRLAITYVPLRCRRRGARDIRAGDLGSRGSVLGGMQRVAKPVRPPGPRTALCSGQHGAFSRQAGPASSMEDRTRSRVTSGGRAAARQRLRRLATRSRGRRRRRCQCLRRATRACVTEWLVSRAEIPVGPAFDPLTAGPGPGLRDPRRSPSSRTARPSEAGAAVGLGNEPGRNSPPNRASERAVSTARGRRPAVMNDPSVQSADPDRAFRSICGAAWGHRGLVAS